MPILETALAHHRAGEFDKAIALYRRLARLDPANTEILRYLAHALELLGQVEAATVAVQQAVRAEPGNLLLREHLSRLFMEQGEPDAVVALWQDLDRVSGGAPAARVGLARHLAAARRPGEALAALDEGLKHHPGEPLLVFESARLGERMGRDESARALLQTVLTSQPDHAECAILLARLDARGGDPAAALDLLRGLLARRADAPGAVHSELALILEKLGDHPGAFESAARGQALAFQALSPPQRSFDMHEHLIEEALRITPETVALWPAPAGDAALPPRVPGPPVLIVGFPRSGTTLIEQMLGAHPRLAVSDELPNLQGVRQKMYGAFQPRGHFPRSLGVFTAAEVAKGRKWYLDRAYRSVPGAAPPLGEGVGRRIVDKQPLNTLDLCFARLILPESPVIYVQRDPRDTVLSVFMQGFTRGVPHLFSLEGTARLYDLFAQVWEHYRRVLGLRTLVVRYEDLVARQEATAREMVEFIGEEWDPAVMNFYAPEHRRYVTTPSYADVAQPVYTRAVARWKRYERHLAPVLPILEPWVRAGGYT